MGRNDDAGSRSRAPAALDVALAALAARQHGVVSLAQLRTLGLSSRGVQHRAQKGRLHRLHRAVYAVGHTALTRDGHRMAAVLACGPGAVLSHASAADAWGIRPTSQTRWAVTTTGRTGRTGPAAVRLHRVRGLHVDDVARLRRIPLTSVARTLVDLAAVLRPEALERAVHQAEVLRILDLTEVEAALARIPNRAGARHLRTLLAEPSAGHTRSALEERFLALCRGGGLPPPRLNRHIPTAGGLVEVDACWPSAALVVELDGAAAHRTRRAFHADRRRDAALAAEGYLVVRLTWERVTREPDAVTWELARILALRGGPAGAG